MKIYFISNYRKRFIPLGTTLGTPWNKIVSPFYHPWSNSKSVMRPTYMVKHTKVASYCFTGIKL